MMLGHGEFWGGVPNDKVHLYLSKENPNPSLDVRLTKGDSPHSIHISVTQGLPISQSQGAPVYPGKQIMTLPWDKSQVKL